MQYVEMCQGSEIVNDTEFMAAYTSNEASECLKRGSKAYSEATL
jgi:hypothetical protein